MEHKLAAGLELCDGLEYWGRLWSADGWMDTKTAFRPSPWHERTLLDQMRGGRWQRLVFFVLIVTTRHVPRNMQNAWEDAVHDKSIERQVPCDKVCASVDVIQGVTDHDGGDFKYTFETLEHRALAYPCIALVQDVDK